jgi:hypothetical protein
MEKRILELKRNLEKKTTEELRQIYQEKNSDEWTKEAFLAIEFILNERVALQGNEKLGCQYNDVLCIKCGSANFDYDSSWKEYSCNNCGWVAKDKEKISYLVANKIRQEDNESDYEKKTQQVKPDDTNSSVYLSSEKPIKKVHNRFWIFWVILICAALVYMRVNSKSDETLINIMNEGLKIGNFMQPETLKAVSMLLNRDHPKAKEPKVIDCLITTGALLLTDDAEWMNRNEARDVYNLIKQYNDGIVVNGLVRKVIRDEGKRLHVLFLGIKLGVSGSQERLNKVLYKHGDEKMAEDFLNSGSPELYEGGKRWAKNHGYTIKSGVGSHRASWGKF